MAARVVLAARDVTAERRRAAALDCTHHLHLVEAHVARVGQTPSGTVVAEDVRDLQSWTGHETGATSPAAASLPRFLVLLRVAQPIERALDGGDQAGGHASVACRRLQLVVSEQRLDRSDIDPAIVEVRCNAVPQRVQVDRLARCRPLGHSSGRCR